MIEVRWHARAGQGAKSAAQLLAEAALRSGKSAQAFPEYGPERRGAPMRAYTRVDDKPIRRHDAVTRPNVVVVLEPSLVHEIDVTDGLADGGTVVLNAAESPAELDHVHVVCVPRDRERQRHARGCGRRARSERRRSGSPTQPSSCSARRSRRRSSETRSWRDTDA